MGRKSNAQLEMEAKMAQEAVVSDEQTEEVSTPNEEPETVPTAKETASKGIPADAHWTVMPERPDSLREMNISAEERDTLIRMKVKSLIDKDDAVSLPGPRVRSLLRCPVRSMGLENVYILMDIDVRILDQIKDYYYDNAIDPAPEKLLNLIEDIVGHKSPYYPRVITRDWTVL